MIVEFNIVWVDRLGVMAMAIMLDGPPIPVGVFEDFSDAEEACEQFQVEHNRGLH